MSGVTIDKLALEKKRKNTCNVKWKVNKAKKKTVPCINVSASIAVVPAAHSIL